MNTESKRLQQDRFFTVEVHDPQGQKSIFLEGLRASTRVSEVRNRAIPELALSEGVEWNIRHEQTGRLLHDDQRLSDFVDASGQVTLKLQPDASLG